MAENLNDVKNRKKSEESQDHDSKEKACSSLERQLKWLRPSDGWSENQSELAQNVQCTEDKMPSRKSLPRKSKDASKLKTKSIIEGLKKFEVKEKRDKDETVKYIQNILLSLVQEKVVVSSEKEAKTVTEVKEKSGKDEESKTVTEAEEKSDKDEKKVAVSSSRRSRNQSLPRKRKNPALKVTGPKVKRKPIVKVEEKGDENEQILKHDREKIVASSDEEESSRSRRSRKQRPRGKPRTENNQRAFLNPDSPQVGSTKNLERKEVEKKPRQTKPLFVRNYFICRPFAINGEKELDFVIHETYIKGTVPRDSTEDILDEVDVETDDEDDEIDYSSCTEDEDNAERVKLFEDIIADF